MKMPSLPVPSPFKLAAGSLIGLACIAAQAQLAGDGGGSGTVGGSGAGSGGLGGDISVESDPNPYYIGIRQGFGYDSNIFHTPFGPDGGGPAGDSFSTTSLFGGFDQPIGRQRVFGRADVSLNRYNHYGRLDNTSYGLGAGLAWSTIEKLSGSLNVGLSRRLASPAQDDAVPDAQRNSADTKSVSGTARWGGASVLTLEAAAGYSKLDYSSSQYSNSDSSNSVASLGVYYRPGGLLRLGLAGRYTRTRSPRAFTDIDTGETSANTQSGRNIDLLADYAVSGLLSASGRLSYTDQTNTALANSADFSGLTGGFNIAYRATGKIAASAYASRDAGFNSGVYGSTTPIGVGAGTAPVPVPTAPTTPAGPSTPSTPVSVPASGLYENNQVTNAFGLGVSYAATAKISASLGARYARARLISNTGDTSTRDVLKTAYLGVNYAVTYNVGLSCSFGRELRDVMGDFISYSYSASTVGCSGAYTWR